MLNVNINTRLTKAVFEVSIIYMTLFQINGILEKFPVWREYKDQKHDLFLSDKPVAGYLTG